MKISFKFTALSRASRVYLGRHSEPAARRFRLMLANRGLGSGDQSACEQTADAAPAIKVDRRERAYRCGGE